MARINSNVSAVTAQRHLNTAYRSLDSTLQKLSSGLRINRGADDPAGLIVSERLRSEISGVSQAIRNTQRASNVIATAEGALNEVAALLNSIQALTIEAANTGAFSLDEIKANQLQVDSAIESITRISNATTFAGRALIDGSLDYVTSGISNAALARVGVNSVQFGTRPFVPVVVNVTAEADEAHLIYPNATVASAVNIEVRGNVGVVTLPFEAGTPASAMVAAINSVRDATGVIASATPPPGAGLAFNSANVGSSQFVEVKPLPGSNFITLNETGGQAVRDIGVDVTATINGTLASGDGYNATLKTTALDIELTVTPGTTGTTSFAITGGGSLYQLGAHVNTNEQVSLGIQSTAASRLGNTTLGFLSQLKTGESFALETTGGPAQASKIVDEAIRQISIVRGRLGAFEKNTLDTNINQLGITMENLIASESTIRDTDFAAETSRLTRNQILVSAGTSVLGLANQTPSTVLSLLGG
jgi:flagellin